MLMDWKNIAKMSILPKAIYSFNVIPFQLPTTFVAELEQTILNVCRNAKDTKIAKAILWKKDKARGIYSSWFQAILGSYSNWNNILGEKKKA